MGSLCFSCCHASYCDRIMVRFLMNNRLNYNTHRACAHHFIFLATSVRWVKHICKPWHSDTKPLVMATEGYRVRNLASGFLSRVEVGGIIVEGWWLQNMGSSPCLNIATGSLPLSDKLPSQEWMISVFVAELTLRLCN